MPHFVLPDLLLEPRCSLSVIKNQSQPIGWIIHCLATDAQCALDTGVSPELSDELKLPAEMASLTALYGKLQPGMIYLSCDHSIPGTAGARAPAAYLFLSRAQISALDNTRPGKRHVSFALGAMLWDALQLKKEILGLGVLTVDLRGVLGQGFVSSEEDFFASLLARSAKNTLGFVKKNSATRGSSLCGLIKSTEKSETLQLHFVTSDPVVSETHLAVAQDTAFGLLLTRSLVNAPPNFLRPSSYEKLVIEVLEQLKKLRPEEGALLSFESYQGDSLEQLNCRLIQAVGQGSASSPRLLKLSYRPRGDSKIVAEPQKRVAEPQKRVALVGKGVTFDSGGYDLKPSGPMRNMKKDMGGSAAAFGAFCAAVLHKLPVQLDCYLALAENMVSGDSFRPGDVYVARDGSLVEIDNTDAEGRLVLADALHLAAESNPDWIIDFATLTGAARVALGPDVDALFSNEAEKALLLATSGIETGDWVWQLPRVPSYLKMLDSSVGDMVNSSATGHGGAVTAAIFLEKFVGKIPWSHIDTYMWTDKPHPLSSTEPGATGKCVRLVLEVLQRYTSNAER